MMFRQFVLSMEIIAKQFIYIARYHSLPAPRWDPTIKSFEK
ncbi:hypothetical protein CAter282_3758 [Collimonas arenae]|uniref:Uncharacterized protein n=1 Tax=Collimonas arenae TaxID=279058 RepID=A0A127QN89_9BURK|nr:hypothetical protein CAter282_3758 [Collimonas arenae]